MKIKQINKTTSLNHLDSQCLIALKRGGIILATHLVSIKSVAAKIPIHKSHQATETIRSNIITLLYKTTNFISIQNWKTRQ